MSVLAEFSMSPLDKGESVSKYVSRSLEIISNSEEANLGLQSCLPLLHGHRPYGLVFDIGGGSTELSWLRLGTGSENGHDGVNGQGAPQLCGWHSIPIAVVGLAERFGGDRILPETYAAMIDEVYEALLPFEEDHGIGGRVSDGQVQMLGTSGTVTTLAGLQLELPRYDRAVVDGAFLGFDDVHRLSRQLADMAYPERVAQPCIGVERADLVVAGCAVLAAICQIWPVGRLRVADRGLRDGILLGLMRAAENDRHDGPPRRATPA